MKGYEMLFIVFKDLGIDCQSTFDIIESDSLEAAAKVAKFEKFDVSYDKFTDMYLKELIPGDTQDSITEWENQLKRILNKINHEEACL